MTAGANPSGQTVPEGHLRPSPAPEPTAPPTAPLTLAGAGDQCPTCGSHMAADQRYCLNCGQRRGDPRLPFMDAVTFMDASKQPRGDAAAAPPPPPSERKPRLSANASLIAGVATLVLAIGVGVLIGRGGESGGSTANTTPPVIKVEGGGGGSVESETTASTNSGKESSSSKSGSGKSGKASKATKEKSETGSSGTSKAAEEVLKPSGNVNLPAPTQEVGGSCEKGTAGCSESGEFNGSFFGE